MRYFLIVAALLSVCGLWAQLTDLPTCYNTYDEITQMLADYQAQHPDIARRVLIGYSQQDNLPIYAMRISDNVENDEEEPALLFVGQVHAEEVLGVQITLSNIEEILTNRTNQPYAQWINFLDMWFVPTLNPEGHNVVTSNMDTSYRKNKRDINGNGIFDFAPLVGYDIDGVDINRNFSFNWCHGDTLGQPPTLEAPEAYDYYRGHAPMSESENQAIKALCDQYKFVYSICWHSSRSGNFSEKAYYSFNWKEQRPSPDNAFAFSICQGISSQIIKQDGTGPYQALPNLGRKGAFHDWMYQQYGSFQILVECGTRHLQPDSTLMVDTVQRCSNGVRWLLNRALPFSNAVPSSSMLTGNIRDAVTQEPLEAEIIVENRHAPWFRPRTSNPDTGRYWKALPTGSYPITIRKRGYWDLVVPSVMVYNGSWTIRNFDLEPKTPVTVTGSVTCNGQPLAAKLKIIAPETDIQTLDIYGNFSLETFEGQYTIEVTSPGHYPYLGTMEVSPSQNQFHFQLGEANVYFSEDWESGVDGWNIQGPWVLQDQLAVSGHAITDSWGGWGFYEMNCDVWISTGQPISIPATANNMLAFDSHVHTEYGYDFVTVEISTDGEQWTPVWQKSGQHDHFRREYVPLDAYSGQSIWMRFRLTDQSVHVELTDPGWTIDNIQIFNGCATPLDEPLAEFPAITRLWGNHPNPFNPSTTISYDLARPGPARISIFNLRGQIVRKLVEADLPAGRHQVIWDGKDDRGNALGSGIYFYRLESKDYRRTQKMMLIK